ITALNRELEHHIDELEHVSRALRTLSAGNRTMLRAGSEQELLESMCKAIVETGGYDTAVVWYCHNDDGKALKPAAESGYPGGLSALDTLKATWADDEYGRGAVGSAIRNQETCVVSDLPNDPRYRQWKAELRDATSVIACPLRVDGTVIGALAIYDAERNAFGRDEGALLTESAEDLAYGIAALRARVAQRRNQEAMHRLTHHDALTGLPNETQFTESLTAALAEGKLNDRPFAILQANIERLSQINDALGFNHGDQLLRAFGDRLRSAVPEFAMVARLRGDEFAVLLPDSNAGAALSMVRQLQRELETPFRIADISLEVSAKIGVALFPEHGPTVHDLYRHMDIAMRLAKKRDMEHVIFDATMNTAHSRSLTIASELRRAIERGDLLLYLQPKVEIASGRLCGAEALVRWKHAERGLIPPNEFIGLAENTGLIKPLTEWVVETAMLLNRDWGEMGCALPIAVNLSARNLRDGHLLERIRNLRAAMGPTAGLFEIEITESTVMEDAEFALQVLHSLRDEGIPLYIDDFGTGYSSLAYLQKLPVEYIKIDQSFIRNMAVRKDSERIVHSTVDLIRDLGRKSVAEGIEDQATWNLLTALGCDLGQGYFIARPMPSEDFQDWIKGYRPLAITHPPSTEGEASSQR
ncbi:MAG: putative bifunctional diguanylate cyclase/phosphodiesterase, partial [Betaproteobacteria bacterium]